MFGKRENLILSKYMQIVFKFHAQKDVCECVPVVSKKCAQDMHSQQPEGDCDFKKTLENTYVSSSR